MCRGSRAFVPPVARCPPLIGSVLGSVPTARLQPGSLEGGGDLGVMSLKGCAGGSRVRIRGKYETCNRGLFRIERNCIVIGDMGHGTRIWYTLPGSVMCAINNVDDLK